MESLKLAEMLKQLQKIHCKTCSADYETCQSCRFHRAVNDILAEAIYGRGLTVFVLPPQVIISPNNGNAT
jgi:hypothetical protein